MGEQAEVGVDALQPDDPSQLIIQDVSDSDEDEEGGRAVSPSIAVEHASLIEDEGAPAGDLVTRTLAMLPGGKEEIGRSAESWIEREQWDQNDEDSLEGESGRALPPWRGERHLRS